MAEIIGIGSVEFVDGCARAVPGAGYDFKHWLVGGEIITDNPANIIGNDYTAVFYVSVGTYLTNSIGFDISAEALIPICVDRGISVGDDVTSITVKAKELAKADLYLWAVGTPSTVSGTEEADGYWKHKERGYQSNAFDKRNLLKMANDIYAKYGEGKRLATFKLFNI